MTFKPALLGFGKIARDHAEVITGGEQDVDLSPHQLVADALMLGRRVQVEPFIELGEEVESGSEAQD